MENSHPMTLDEFLTQWHEPSDTVPVHTSGSTGIPKLLLVEKERMRASARLTCRFLNLQPGDTALLCMPLDYIAGKMMVVRSLEWHLRLLSVPPSSHPLKDLTAAPVFAAMVPLQVYQSLQLERERELLQQIRHLLIGGGVIDEALEKRLSAFPHAVWSSYGMTETLSHIALRRVNGSERSLWYTPLEGVRVRLSEDGCLCVHAPWVGSQELMTNDCACLHPDGKRFRILGRKDNVIDSGGIKIQIEEVERLLHPHLSFPFLITSCRDERLGEQVVMMVEDREWLDNNQGNLTSLCASLLPPYWRPRQYMAVGKIPLTETGKPARAEARKMAALWWETHEMPSR